MEIPAIDFRQLLKEEKRKAREKLRLERERRIGGSTDGGREKEEDEGEEGRSSREEKAESTASTTPRLPSWIFPERRLDVPRLDRKKHCVCKNPPTIFYVSDYLPAEFQERLSDWLQRLPENPVSVRQEEDYASALSQWNRLRHARRRVALFETTDDQTEFPPPLRMLCQALISSGVFPEEAPPNHILINEYGNQSSSGILPHTDGPAYQDRTATVSVGGPVLLQFAPARGGLGRKVQLLLEGTPASLVVFEGAAYSDFLHSIDDCASEHAGDACVNAEPGTGVVREYRISITVRRKRKAAEALLS
jgi:alkylated DNA repair protein alkB family protein 6